MKVLIDGMPRTTGGIGSLVMNLVKYGKRTGDEMNLSFDFIVPAGSHYISELNENGFSFHVSPPLYQLPAYYRFLKALFKQNAYDYLWFNNTSKVNLLLPLYAKKHGVKLIAHPHGVDMEEKGIKRVVYKLLDVVNRKKMFSLIDVPFACSEEAANVYYRGNDSLRQRTTIIRNGIAVGDYAYIEEKRQKIRYELSIAENDILLGAVGRLTAVKNYPFLIRLMEGLDAKYTLIIIGVGEDQATLQKLIEEMGLSGRCHLLGSRSNVPEYLSAMDVFFLPSFHEGFPFSVVEAQCAGLPCLVSDSLSHRIKITDLVSFLPLNNLDAWQNTVLKTERKTNREAYAEVVRTAGYDIGAAYEALRCNLCGEE